MKSAHRHELQTNALAQRLDTAIERLRPHMSTIAFGVVALIVLILIWSFLSSASESRHGEAWNGFNEAVGSMPPNLELLRQTAEEYPGTQMQVLADLTWADGQVFAASENYLYNRKAASDALDKATGAYQGVLQSTDDSRLIHRAHLGLARVYEMRGEFPKAIDEYKKVKGGYAEYAKFQAERLEKPEAKETYDWLAKAEAPRRPLPTGPGMPGRRPAFTPGDLDLPAIAPGAETPGATGATEPATSFEDLLKGLQTPTESGTRYEESAAPPADGSGPSSETAPAADTGEPAAGTSPPATETATETPADATSSNGAAPAESATPPAADAESEKANSTEDSSNK